MTVGEGIETAKIEGGGECTKIFIICIVELFSNSRQPLSHAPQTIKSLLYIVNQVHIPNWREDIPPQADRKLPLTSSICFISGMHGE